MKDLLTIASLAQGDLEELLSLAAELKSGRRRAPDLLSGQLVMLYFAKPSTRTRFSFEAAVHRLGGSAVNVSFTDLQLSRGETIEDTARTISHFASAAVLRTPADAEQRAFAEAASIPVVNALSDCHHPCQALADMLTLKERLGQLRGATIAFTGDCRNNVARSLTEAALTLGMHVRLGGPAPLHPAGGEIEGWLELAAESGGSIIVTADPFEAVSKAAAVYTDTWFSMGAESDPARAGLLAPFQVNERLMGAASPGALFMHCLPAHRGEEVTAEVLDGPRSIVWDQVENRAHTEEAVLVALLEHRLRGRSPC